MKKIYVFLFSIFSLFAFSQAPKLINYQGVVRNATGIPVTSPVKLKFEIFPVSSGGSPAFTEVQSTVTNSLGLFSTQIGKTSPLNINWSTGSWFLELSVDTTNTGSSFTVIGRQQMVSVPFALFAENAGSAPAPSVTFSNNILYVGTNSVSLPPAPVYFAGNGITINSGTIINTAPDQTVTITGAGNAVVNGPYPDFTVTANPQVLAITNNVISLSNGGGSIVLPATSTTPNTSLTATGIATVTSSGTNTFNIAVAAPNITGTGGTTVGGTYPNLTINSPTVGPATIVGGGIAGTSSSGNNFTVTVPGPVLSYGGNVLTVQQGTATSAVTIPAGVTPTITGSGVASTSSSGSNYTVNVPAPALSIGGNALTVTQGTASSTVLLPAPPLTTITGQGIATVTPLSGNNFTVNVAPLNLTGTGGVAVTGTYPNININAQAWSLLGNTGTNASTNFLGTTDNIPLNFRVNNQKSGRIDPLLSNTFFGYWSGRDNTTGTQNSAYGINSLYQNTTGSGNSVFGTTALQSNLTGNNNTAIGVGAGNLSVGSGNVFLGYNAGANETGSNKLYIANNPSNPLLFGDFTTGRIGLGTVAPSIGKLEITHSSNASGLQTSIYTDLTASGGGNYIGTYSRVDGTTSAPVLGLRGFAVGTGSGDKTGVEGYASGNSAGVNNFGVKGFATGPGINYGVFGDASGGTLNYAGYFSQGNVFIQNKLGIGTNNPTNAIDIVGGSIRVQDGSQGVNKVFTSDAGGNGTWQNRNTIVSSIVPPGCQSVNSVGTTPILLANLGSFTKSNAATIVEINFQTFINVFDLGTASGVYYELRVDGIPAPSNGGKTIYFKNNGNVFSSANNDQVNILALFPSLAAGNHTVSVYVYTLSGISNSVFYDPGCWSANSVIVKEMW